MYLSSKDANTTGTAIHCDPTLLNLNQVNFQPTLTQLVRWGIQANEEPEPAIWPSSWPTTDPVEVEHYPSTDTTPSSYFPELDFQGYREPIENLFRSPGLSHPTPHLDHKFSLHRLLGLDPVTTAAVMAPRPPPPQPTPKPRRRQPGIIKRKYVRRMTKEEQIEKGNNLWQFLMRLLQSRADVVHWTGKDLEFRIVNKEEIARQWGLIKNRERMNFDKFSRALRYYYNKRILIHNPQCRLTYCFMRNPGEGVFSEMLQRAMRTIPGDGICSAYCSNTSHQHEIQYARRKVRVRSSANQ
eukprot:sb/3467460/